MEVIKVNYGGYEVEQCVDSHLFNAIYNKGTENERNKWTSDIEGQILNNAGDIDETLVKVINKIKADIIDEIRDAMSFNQKGLGGYFTISQDEWNDLENKYGVK